MPNPMKITTIREKFPNEWVATEVTKVDKNDVPLAGVIIAHSADKSMVYRTVKAHLGQYPATRIFLFFAGDPIPESVEVALALC